MLKLFKVGDNAPKNNDKPKRQGERGNVLFLILIAVALFAALSYAVTQTTRGGGNSASNETDLINTAQITQYPAVLKTAIIRMLITGKSYRDLEFNLPGDFEGDITGDLCTVATNDDFANCVFHTTGGGATYSKAPATLMADASPGEWYFNLEAEIEDIGTNELDDFDGNDLIAFLPGITEALCERLNDALSIDDDDVELAADESANYTINMTVGYSEEDETFVIGDADSADLLAQPFGCFQNGGGDGEFVYFHVLVEQ